MTPGDPKSEKIAWSCAPARRRGKPHQALAHPLGGAKNELYDIGTIFLFVQCFFTTDMFLFCKTILYSGNCRIFRDLAFGSIKTRFKAILKKLEFSAQIDFSTQIYFFHELLPSEGDFSAQICFFNEPLPPEGDFSAQKLFF